jgi:hypothetical protein
MDMRHPASGLALASSNSFAVALLSISLLSLNFSLISSWYGLSALMYSADFVCCMESGRSPVLTTVL